MYGFLGACLRARAALRNGAWSARRWLLPVFAAVRALLLLLLPALLLWLLAVCVWTPRYFVMYTTRDFQAGTAAAVAARAELYLQAHANEKCVSTLELSVHGNRTYFHIASRTPAMDRRRDGAVLHMLNPVFLVPARESDVAREVTATELPTAELKAPNYAAREANTFCDYVYHNYGNWATRVLQLAWPHFALHTNDVPVTNTVRWAVVRVRFRNLHMFDWEDRTLDGDHAQCVQHYMDVYNKKLQC